MLLDWSLQYFGILESTNLRRLMTGFIGGLGVTMLHLYFYCVVYRFSLACWKAIVLFLA